MKKTNRRICFAALLTSAFLAILHTYRSRELEETPKVLVDPIPVPTLPTSEAPEMDAVDLATEQPERAREVGEAEFAVDSDSSRAKPLPDHKSSEKSTPLEHPSSDHFRPSTAGYFLLSGVALIDAYKRSVNPTNRLVSPQEREALLNTVVEMGGKIVPLRSIVVRRPHDEILMELSQAEGPESPWVAASLHLESARGRGEVLWSDGRLYDLKDGQFVDQEGHRLDPKIVRATWGLGKGEHLHFRGPDYRGFRLSFRVDESASGGHYRISGDHGFTWIHGEGTSIGNSLNAYGLPDSIMLGQTLYFELHGGIWTQVLLTFEAVDSTEWRELLENGSQDSVPQEPESLHQITLTFSHRSF